MNVIDQINQFVENVNQNESVAGGLRKSIAKQKTRGFPKTHFFMTELTNPVEAFYRRNNPKFQPSEDLGRKLAWGITLHNLASYWFREHDDFVVCESTIDGALLGIAGVRGRIDYLIGDSIIEFKSKDSNPKDEDEVFNCYINDLEQVVFYAAIHPQSPTINYLVFIENVTPFRLKAFKISIKDLDAIRELLSSRIKLLNAALEAEDPSKLGRCRYYDLGCRFSGSGICSCSKMEALDASVLLENIILEFDEEYTKNLESIRIKTSDKSQISCYTTYDIIAPRKNFMKEVLGFDSSFQPDPRKLEYKNCLYNTMYQFKKNFGCELTDEEKQWICDRKSAHRVLIGNRWLKLRTSSRPNGVILPYVLKANNTSYRQYADNPGPYSIAELGIMCALYGIDHGLVCTVFPNLGDLVNVFEVKFKSLGKLSKFVCGVVDCLDESKNNEDILSLPECIGFMNKDSDCPLMAVCSKGENCKG